MPDSSLYPGALDTFTSKIDNENFVVAQHVNLLQNAVDAIQAVLGTSPAGIHDDVKSRIEGVETNLSTHTSGDDHDLRYGGSGWNPVDDITIKSHQHNNTGSNPNLISLTSHVTGTLPKGNIQISPYNNVNTLTGADIHVSTTSDTKINTALGNRLSLTGGTITGNVTITAAGALTLNQPINLSNLVDSAPITLHDSAASYQVNHLNANFVMGKRIYVQTNTPDTKAAGDLWFDTTA